MSSSVPIDSRRLSPPEIPLTSSPPMQESQMFLICSSLITFPEVSGEDRVIGTSCSFRDLEVKAGNRESFRAGWAAEAGNIKERCLHKIKSPLSPILALAHLKHTALPIRPIGANPPYQSQFGVKHEVLEASHRVRQHVLLGYVSRDTAHRRRPHLNAVHAYGALDANAPHRSSHQKTPTSRGAVRLERSAGKSSRRRRVP